MKKILLLKILFLFIGFQLKAQIQNDGFEDWLVDSLQNENPLGWQTTNVNYRNSILKTTDSYSGNFAMKLGIPKDTMFVGFEGGIANTWAFSPNIVRNSAIGLSFYVKCDNLSDYISAFVAVYGRNLNGQCLGSWWVDTLIPTYSLVEIPFDLSKIDTDFNLHDSITVFIFASSPTNSQGLGLGSISLKIDDVKLIDEPEIVNGDEFKIYPNPAVNELQISVTSSKVPFNFMIYDELGSLIHKGFSETELASVKTENWSQGHYLMKLYRPENGASFGEYPFVIVK